jgi:hypothetical protein
MIQPLGWAWRTAPAHRGTAIAFHTEAVRSAKTLRSASSRWLSELTASITKFCLLR